MEEPDKKRRLIRREYRMAEVRMRKMFDIEDNELILDFEYDKQNSSLILTTLLDCEEKKGDK